MRVAAIPEITSVVSAKLAEPAVAPGSVRALRAPVVGASARVLKRVSECRAGLVVVEGRQPAPDAAAEVSSEAQAVKSQGAESVAGRSLSIAAVVEGLAINTVFLPNPATILEAVVPAITLERLAEDAWSSSSQERALLQ